MKVRMGLAPLQFSDDGKQKTHDIEKLFGLAIERRWAWIFGTESGPGAGITSDELFRVAHESDYKPWVPARQGKGKSEHTDCWIMVRKDLISGNWSRGYEHAVDSSGAMRDEMDIPKNKSWGPKGLVHAAFDCDKLDARVSLGAAHYLTEGRDPSSPYWDLNQKLADTVDNWGAKASKGLDLAWYGGDQNMADSKNDEPQGDTFMGGKFLSSGDELKKWFNTGHGPIDVIARRKNDRRVAALNLRVFDDRDFFLFTDHHVSEATYEVDPSKR